MSRRKQSNPRHLDGENENRKFVCLFVCPALTLSFVLLFPPGVIFVVVFLVCLGFCFGLFLTCVLQCLF